MINSGVVAEFDLAQKSNLFFSAIAVQGNNLNRPGRRGTATSLRHNMRCATRATIDISATFGARARRF
jgi:hypothetical protein